MVAGEAQVATGAGLRDPTDIAHGVARHIAHSFAWEDTFKRLLLRFERIQQRHYGMKLMAYTLSNLRAFCGI